MYYPLKKRESQLFLFVCRHCFNHRDQEYQALFAPAKEEYLKRLKGHFDGECLESRADALAALGNEERSPHRKQKAEERDDGNESDYGEQRRVDKEGRSRACKNAEYHFNLKSVLGRKAAGRGPNAPTSTTFNPPSKPQDPSSSSSSASSSSSSTANKGALSPSKRATGRGRRVIAETQKTGMKGRFIIFRHRNPMLQRQCEFPLLLGEVVGINEDPENEVSWKGRPDGAVDPDTGIAVREKWTWAVKRHALKMTLNSNLTKVPDLRKAAWWTHNYLVDHERATNHSHMFMDKKTVERLQQKASKKAKQGGKSMGHSTVYVDFANPDHGFVLLDDNAEFTKTGILSKHCLKCIIRKDATARADMDKYAQDKLDELDLKKGSKSERFEPPAASSAAAAQGTYSPFAALALMDAGEKSDSDESDVGGIFEEEDNDEEGKGDEAVNGEMVAAFIDKVNEADDEDLGANDSGAEDQGRDNNESDDSDDEPPDVVFIGGKPPPPSALTCYSSAVSASSKSLALGDAKHKGRGRPVGSKNVKKK